MKPQEELDHLFRREYGRLVSVLSSRFSHRYIDLIEDAVQESMYKALAIWPFKGMPNHPAAWLQQVARNELVDRLRKVNRSPETQNSIHEDPTSWSPLHPSGLEDETLRMLFACCHPAMTVAEQTMLSLKLLCGFGVKEIAAALLKKPEAVKRAISRAKVKFKTEVGTLDVPEGITLSQRLDAVLRVLYLLFNEGYKSAGGGSLIQQDMSEEAFRLASLLYHHNRCRSGELCALMALMCYTAARYPARLNEAGKMLTLDKQDRKLWDREMIEMGEVFLHEAIEGIRVSRYHLEAGIARCHTIAPAFKETDWFSILQLYNLLHNVEHSTVVALNRIVAVLHVQGAKRAYEDLLQLEKTNDVQSDYLYHSIKAEIILTLKKPRKLAEHHLTEAIRLCENEVERSFLSNKLTRLART